MTTNIVPFSLELAQELHNSEEEFPVGFDNAVIWLEYSRKDSAKRALIKNFVNGSDYIVQTLHTDVERSTGVVKIEFESIRLTANCLKEMGMLAGTEKGREVRKYFIECERIAKTAALIVSQLQKENAALKEQLNHDIIPHKLALEVTDTIAQIKDKLADDPRLCQYLIDYSLNSIPSHPNQKALPSITWSGVVEIAEKMNLPVSIKNRSQLGLFVKSAVGAMGRTEERLCNGRMTPIMVYPDCEDVRNAIAQRADAPRIAQFFA